MAVFNCSVKSDVLGMRTGVTVIMPTEHIKRADNNLSVLYLLHGLSDDYTCWLYKSNIERYADDKGFIVIMPEVQRSFYTDMEYGLNYFTYVAHELPEMVENLFGITHTRDKTFIAGLSMGGYGAVKCALRRPDFYGACASFSGALDVSFRKDVDEFPDFKFITGGNDVKPEDNLFNLAEDVSKLPLEKRPGIFITCGTEDFLYNDNKSFTAKLDEYGLEYTYEEWPGTHEWGFWDLSVQKALDFFNNLRPERK